MKAVWKFELQPKDGAQQITGPGLSKIVHFALQGDTYCAWAEVEEGREFVTKSVAILGTGQRVPSTWEHRGTFQAGAAFVWHLYEAPRPA